MALCSHFLLPPPTPFLSSYQCPVTVTGKSILLSASGDQGVGVECCEVFEKNSVKQKAEFSLVYTLKSILFI